MMISYEQNLIRLYQQFSDNHDLLRQRLLDQLADEPAPVQVNPRRRSWLFPTALSTIAAAILLSAALWFLPSGTQHISKAATLSWAAAVERMKQVKSVTYIRREHTTYLDGTSSDAYETRAYIRWPYQERSEFIGKRPRGAQSLGLDDPDRISEHHLDLSGRQTGPRQHERVVRPGTREHRFTRLLVKAVNLDDRDVVRTGEEVVDGKTLIRFDSRPSGTMASRTEAHLTTSIWVDPATSLPVKVIQKFHPLRAPNADERTDEMDDMRFNMPLDDKLFAPPDLNAARETLKEQWLMLEGTRQGRFTIAAPDGTVLASTDDLIPPAKGSLTDLTPAALAHLEKFTTDHIGQKLTVQMDKMGSKDVTIFAAVKNVRIW